MFGIRLSRVTCRLKFRVRWVRVCQPRPRSRAKLLALCAGRDEPQAGGGQQRDGRQDVQGLHHGAVRPQGLASPGLRRSRAELRRSQPLWCRASATTATATAVWCSSIATAVRVLRLSATAAATVTVWPVPVAICSDVSTTATSTTTTKLSGWIQLWSGASQSLASFQPEPHPPTKQ